MKETESAARNPITSEFGTVHLALVWHCMVPRRLPTSEFATGTPQGLPLTRGPFGPGILVRAELLGSRGPGQAPGATGKSRAAGSKARPTGQHHELPLGRPASFQPPEEPCGVHLRRPSVRCPGISSGAGTHVGSSRWSTLCAPPWFAPFAPKPPSFLDRRATIQPSPSKTNPLVASGESRVCPGAQADLSF